MKLGSLFSGGKDSAFAIYLAQKQGHTITCLLSVFPRSNESHLLHHPNLKWTKLQHMYVILSKVQIRSNFMSSFG